MCAFTAAQRGKRVLLIDHAAKLAEKIRISGGGRCNFTNLRASPENYLSQNPHFCRSALARYTPADIIALLEKHKLTYHEKKLGQLFCDQRSQAVIDMLKKECDQAGVQWARPCKVERIEAGQGGEGGDRYRVHTDRGPFNADALIIATGGLSIPQIGATPFGYHVAEQFDVPITQLKPGLVPLKFDRDTWQPFAALSGVSVDASVRFGKAAFRENLLFTHRGLSGPAILQISSYWEHGEPLHIDLVPAEDMREVFMRERASRVQLDNFLAGYLPKRFAQCIAAHWAENKAMNQLSAKTLSRLAHQLHDWQITPSGTLGYAKAEVTCGGIDTRMLSSKTMECKKVPGLYFIGEVVDVTGWLGGYNFQWAWASGYAAGLALGEASRSASLSR